MVEKPTAVDQKSTYFTGIRFLGGETYSCDQKSTYFTGIRFIRGETYSCGSKVYIFYRDQI
jgi:hypothetical protein